MRTVSELFWQWLEAKKTVSKPFPSEASQGFGSGSPYLNTGTVSIAKDAVLRGATPALGRPRHSKRAFCSFSSGRLIRDFPGYEKHHIEHRARRLLTKGKISEAAAFLIAELSAMKKATSRNVRATEPDHHRRLAAAFAILKLCK